LLITTRTTVITMASVICTIAQPGIAISAVILYIARLTRLECS
jgi:hypothetical protein